MFLQEALIDLSQPKTTTSVIIPLPGLVPPPRSKEKRRIILLRSVCGLVFRVVMQTVQRQGVRRVIRMLIRNLIDEPVPQG